MEVAARFLSSSFLPWRECPDGRQAFECPMPGGRLVIRVQNSSFTLIARRRWQGTFPTLSLTLSRAEDLAQEAGWSEIWALSAVEK